jgi:hypothetical protein
MSIAVYVYHGPAFVVVALKMLRSDTVAHSDNYLSLRRIATIEAVGSSTRTEGAILKAAARNRLSSRRVIDNQITKPIPACKGYRESVP